MSKVHVKTGDQVVVINGKDRGARGKVLPERGQSDRGRDQRCFETCQAP